MAAIFRINYRSIHGDARGCRGDGGGGGGGGGQLLLPSIPFTVYSELA